jgi:ClpP class serine protease
MNLDVGALINNLWILIFFFIFLVPQIQRYLLNYSRNNLLKKIAKMRNSTVITLIHRQETVAFFGIPLARYIDIDDSEEVLRAIRTAPPQAPIDIILHTPGGIALAATQIALAVKAHSGKTTVFIPHYAMSGGTLIALAADEICLDPHAVLGPMDPQIGDQSGTYPTSSILKVVEKKKIDKIDDKTLILAEEARKAIKQSKDLVIELINNRYSVEKTKEIVEELVSGKYTHDYPVTKEAASQLLGVCVQDKLPKEIYMLMRLYRMEARPRRPGVEFVPVRARKSLRTVETKFGLLRIGTSN